MSNNNHIQISTKMPIKLAYHDDQVQINARLPIKLISSDGSIHMITESSIKNLPSDDLFQEVISIWNNLSQDAPGFYNFRSLGQTTMEFIYYTEIDDQTDQTLLDSMAQKLGEM